MLGSNCGPFCCWIVATIGFSDKRQKLSLGGGYPTPARPTKTSTREILQKELI